MIPSAQYGLLGRMIGFVVMAVMLVLGLMFSLVLLAGVLVLGLGAFGYFWWKTRQMRQNMKAQATKRASSEGTIIEGEAVVVEHETRSREMPRIAESGERLP